MQISNNAFPFFFCTITIFLKKKKIKKSPSQHTHIVIWLNVKQTEEKSVTNAIFDVQSRYIHTLLLKIQRYVREYPGNDKILTHFNKILDSSTYLSDMVKRNIFKNQTHTHIAHKLIVQCLLV